MDHRSISAPTADCWRIAMVLTRSDTIAGSQVHVRDLAKALIARGHQVTVLVGGNGPFLDELSANQIPFRAVASLVRRIDPLADSVAAVQIRRHLKEINPDLVSTHGAKAGWLGRFAARSLGLPATFTAHLWPFTPGVSWAQSAFYCLAERLAAKLASRIITVADHDRVLALRKGVGRPDQIVTIHCGVAAVSAALWATPEREPPRIIMVARFEAQKDHPTLLRALAELRVHPWTMELVGDGQREARSRELVHKLGIADRVEFAGLRQDVAERLGQAQIFALMTNYEGFPLSVLEAMRAGLPVIASDLAGIREAVEEGRTGLLIPRRDIAAAKLGLERLLSSSALRKQMGSAGQKLFHERFTLDKMVDATIAVYRDVIQRSQRSGRTSKG